MSEVRARGVAAWILLAVAGLSYWFWIGYPFANHNESYAWIAQFETMNLRDALTRHLIGVANWRPLGTAVAWLGYHASHGSIRPVELFNYYVAVAAWGWLACRQSNRRLFALAAFTVGGVLFTGYIYLFHLHGVFYSPLLALVAVLLAADRAGFPARRLFSYFAMAVVVSLFHPFALPLFAAYAGGLWLERRASLAAAAPVMVLSALLALGLLAGGRSVPLGPETWSGLTVSYRMIEIHPAVTAIAMLLVVATVATTRMPATALWVFGAAALAAQGACATLGLSALPVWIVTCAVKLARESRWSWLAMLALAAIFPIAYPTGSPTYTVPAWMIAAATLALGGERWERALARVPDAAAWGGVTLVVACVLALRSGMHVPVLTPLAAPLQAESERTRQMEIVLNWALASPYRRNALLLYREARSPNESSNAVERLHRPPTQQAHLDRYLEERRGGDLPGGKKLVVTFGSEAVPGAEQIFGLPGRYAGEARVYLTSATSL